MTDKYSNQYSIDSYYDSEASAAFSLQIDEVFQGTKTNSDKEREKFTDNYKNGVHTNPEIQYPDANNVDYPILESLLFEYYDEVLSHENDPLIIELYEMQRQEKLRKLQLIKASQECDMPRFRELQEEMNGRPDPTIFHDIVLGIRSKFGKYLESEDPKIHQAAVDLFSSLEHIRTNDKQFHPLPDPDVVQDVREILNLAINQIVELPEDKKDFTLDEAKVIFETALQNIGAEGWIVEIDTESGKTAISVNQNKKLITIPVNRKISVQSISRKKLKELIVHEIDTHTRRRIKAEEGTLRILETGFPTYEEGEEGLAKLKEQVISEDEITEYEGLNSYLAASLAYGIDGIPRDFHDTYDVMYKYFYLKALTGKNADKAEAMAHNNAWQFTKRAFRGTTQSAAGACALDGLQYMGGNIKLWEHLSSLHRNDRSRIALFFQQASIGKFDPTNKRHIEILTILGLI